MGATGISEVRANIIYISPEESAFIVKAMTYRILPLNVLLLVLIVSASCAIVAVPEARAGSGFTLSAYTSATPTIDGNIEASEWVDAATAAIGPFGPGNIYSGTLYMMNDGVNLYIGVIIQGDIDLSSNDNVRFYFDNDNGGEMNREPGDDDIINQGTGTVIGDIFSDGTFDQWDTLFGGTNDGQIASSRQGSLNMFELSHPLDDDDDAHDFSLSAGQTGGFALTVVINDNWITNIPGFGTFSDPSTYANYRLAYESATVGGLMANVNKFEILAPYLVLGGLIVAVSTVYFMKRRAV
jgi:hypothetical protein